MVLQEVLNDLRAVARGVESVISAGVKHQSEICARKWENSSLRELAADGAEKVNHKLKTVTQADIDKAMKETVERTSVMLHSFKSITSYRLNHLGIKDDPVQEQSQRTESVLPKGVDPDDLKKVELDYKDQILIRQLEMEHDLKSTKGGVTEKKSEDPNDYVSEKNTEKLKQGATMKAIRSEEKTRPHLDPVAAQPVATKFKRQKQELSPNSKQRTVPSSRIGRMISFGSLAAGLGVGTIAEAARRTLGIGVSDSKDEQSALDQVFLTEANADRIVNTLCRVRGAALKIGQILSIQDNTIISPKLQKAFERVRQSADFMPSWQVQRVLVRELGVDWRDKINLFEEKPFAAASIGQVHYVVLKDGREAAMKIQYPGVAEGIESDINNLVGIMKIWNIFPKGLFIENLVEVAKRELSWEVDYRREAECTKKFRSLLASYPEYVVPEVIDELSSSKVFTTTLIEGVPIDKCIGLSEDDRNYIGKLLMQLCLRELFEFRYMQTDPNWSNFFYDRNTKKMALLDFGASRSYGEDFLSKYIEVIKAAMDGDRAKVLSLSQEMGFLTGYESKAMEDAHVDAVVILAEVFSADKEFDFGRQDTTLRIQKLVPTIVSERLCPPPEEIYSLHRKLSGIFLLCAKLKVKISCRKMFLDVYNRCKEKMTE